LEAIRINSRLPDAYTNQGATYDGLGQYRRAIEALDKAIELGQLRRELVYVLKAAQLNLGLPVYGNPGNSYGNLGQLQRTMEDHDEAIRLDPRFALAYYNRALAYTYLDKDSEAQRDVERATEPGIDTAPSCSR